MTENGSHNEARPSIGPFYPPQPCPPSAPCFGSRRDPVAEPKPYQRDQLNNAETAELTNARVAAGEEVADARGRIDATGGALLERERDSDTALQLLQDFKESGELADHMGDVRQIRNRHRQDGPEDRRERPGWVRWALWLTVPAAGIYDTAFFQMVFLKLVDGAPSLKSPVFYVALLPGVVITVALLATGHWLAEAALRARAHSERRLERIRFSARLLGWLLRRPAVSQKREREDLPWSRWWLPLLFGLLVVGTLGIWAVNRAHDAQAISDTSTPPGAVAMLLLMFSVTAIAVKVIYHNPFADSVRAADRRCAATVKRYERLAAEATGAVAEFATANRALHGLLDELTAQASRRIDQAWDGILKRRHEHGLAGQVAPPFNDVPPSDRAPGDGSGHTTIIRTPLLAGITEPPLLLEPIHSARQMLRGSEVAAARKRLKDLLTALSGQCAAQGTPG